MKTIAERLKFARDWKGWVQAQLAVAAGVSTGTIGNIESGARQSKGSLPQIAEALGISHKWLADGVGDMEIHTITTPRVKWSLGEEQSNVSEIPRRAKVPLISLIQAGEMTDVEDLFHPGMAAHWVEPRYTNPSEAAYALMVEGDSMESPVPGGLTFPEGTIVIVDPNGSTGPNSYVIAKDVFTQKATFKKLTTDGVRWFLKPLNPAYQTVEIDDPALRVIGKVIEHQPPGGKL